jgi:hypothetical protein
MSNSTIMSDLLHYVVTFAIRQEGQIQYTGESILQCRFVVVYQTMKDCKQTIFLYNVFTTLILCQQVAD